MGNLEWIAFRQEHLVWIGQQKEVWPAINTPLVGIPFNDCTSLSPNLTIQKTFDKMFMPYANMQVQEKNEKKSTNGRYSFNRNK